MPFFWETVFWYIHHHSATVTQTNILPQQSSVCVRACSSVFVPNECFYFHSFVSFDGVFISLVWVGTPFIRFRYDAILKLSFIETVVTHTQMTLASSRWVCLTIATDVEYFFCFTFAHLCGNSDFEIPQAMKPGFFHSMTLCMYGTLINHIICEAIYDHPLKIPCQWVFKRIVVNPLSSEF